MNMPIIVRLATKADLSNRSAAVALRDFEPLMTAVGHQRKCSEGSNDFRSATLTGHDRARLTGPLNATGGPHVETTDVCIRGFRLPLSRNSRGSWITAAQWRSRDGISREISCDQRATAIVCMEM